MIRNVDVIIFVEHKDRELESVKLITEKLKVEGKTSIILSIYFHIHYLYIYRAKLFVFPYLINKNDWPVNFVYKMYGNSVSYLNMNWEQLFSKANEEFKKPQDQFVKQSVYHVSWSDYFKSYLLKHGVNEKNIKITGNPSNEILFNLLDKGSYYKDKLSAEFMLDKDKKWIFFPMNYGWAFFSDKMVLKKINAGYQYDVAYKYREYSQKCLKKFIVFIDSISKKYDYEIIIRPHPSITEEDYRNVFQEVLGYVPQNIFLNKAYSIREWIVSSEIVGSSWSTSVWDAHNIGKSSFLFTPYIRPDWLNVWWNDEVLNLTEYVEENNKVKNKNNLQITSTDKITDLIINILSKKDICVKQKKFIYNSTAMIKILRSFLHEKEILNPKALKYDYFEKVIND